MSLRHDDHRMDWHGARKPMAVRRVQKKPSRLRRLVESLKQLPDGEPSSWRDAAAFLTGTAWGAMVAIGILLAIAARHKP